MLHLPMLGTHRYMWGSGGGSMAAPPPREDGSSATLHDGATNNAAGNDVAASVVPLPGTELATAGISGVDATPYPTVSEAVCIIISLSSFFFILFFSPIFSPSPSSPSSTPPRSYLHSADEYDGK